MAMPANVTTVVVLGTFLTPEGNPSTGTVSFTPSAWLTNSGANVAIPNSTVTKTLGTAGNFSVTLPITDDTDLNPEGWIYTVSEVVDGVSQSYNIAIPGTVATGGTVFLADLVPVAPAGPEYYSLASSLTIGTVTTLPAGSAATADITGLAPNQVLDLGIPTGPQGSAATITVGTTTQVAYGGTALVTNSGTTGDAILDFVLVEGPQGATGATGAEGPQGSAATVTVGTVGAVAYPGPGTVTNSGTSGSAVLDFVLVTGEKGDTGDTGATGPQGPAATIEVGTVTAGTAGGTPSVTNSGSSGSAVLDFVLVPGDTGPQGATGPQGSAATITIGSVTAVAFGGTPSVTNTGTSGSAVLDFVVVTGPQGALGDLTASDPIDYTGNNFSLMYGAGLGTASGGTLVVNFEDSSAAALGVAAAGTINEAARGDHVHAMPSAADVGAVGTATTITAGTGLAGGGDLSANRTLDVEFSDTAAQALGVAAAGTAQLSSRSDHVHALPSAADVGAVGTATSITAGTGLAGGGDLSTSRTIDLVLSDATPQAVGTPAAGTATSPARADHVHEGTTLSSDTPAALGTAAAGTATAAARGDHIHTLPSASDIGAIGNSLISASKGAIITSTGSAVVAQTVGTNGFVLTADSSVTNGIKWAAAASGADIDPLFLAGV